jgi:prefoldin beta subunit
MAAELPPQLQDQLAQLQTLQQQLTMTVQQRQQIEFQVKDTQRALEELESLASDAPVYRSVGSLFVRTPGRDAVKKQLADEVESLQVRLKGFEKQEGRLKEKATELQSKVQAAVKNLGASGGPKPAAARKTGA